MKDQQKLIIAILLQDNKITQTQYNQALALLETLTPAEIAKLNWISQKLHIAKNDIMSAYQKSKELSVKYGTSKNALDSLDLQKQQTSDVKADKTKSTSDDSDDREHTRDICKSIMCGSERIAESPGQS